MSDYFKVNFKFLTPLPNDQAEVKKVIIGEGSFGRVYRASYNLSPVAVKILNDRNLSDEAREQLKKECELMKHLHHPNIGRMFGYSLGDENTCIVMELAELGSLYDVLRNTKLFPTLSWKIRLSIACDIAKGIHFLHSQLPPILHRDLKSLNTLLRKNWVAFLVDFGLAKVKLDSQSVGTKQVGSYAWMAPEMYEEDIVTTPSVDVYSYGMILYELLTREVPWKGLNQARIMNLVLVKNQRPTIPKSDDCPSLKDVPEDYIKLMQECWSQDGKNRPKMDHVIIRLEKLQVSSIAKDEASQVLNNPLAIVPPIKEQKQQRDSDAWLQKEFENGNLDPRMLASLDVVGSSKDIQKEKEKEKEEEVIGEIGDEGEIIAEQALNNPLAIVPPIKEQKQQVLNHPLAIVTPIKEQKQQVLNHPLAIVTPIKEQKQQLVTVVHTQKKPKN